MNEIEAIQVAESHFGVKFIRVKSGEYRSINGCPWCGDGGKGADSDRFRLMIGGNSSPRVWCRKCDQYEFLDKLDKSKELEFRLAAVEREQQEIKRRQEEHENRLRALEAIQHSNDHIKYYNNMGDNLFAVQYWTSEGMSPSTINSRILGYCPKCPIAPYSASYTIPVLYQNTLYNIRHRLISPNGEGKYRPHMKGLPVMIFNADDLHRDEDYILILEGEKKSIIVSQETGLPNIAIMGMQSFNSAWVTKLNKFKKIYVALDPNADDRAIDIARLFGDRGMVVSLPLKADDFFVRAGGKRNDFINYINWARKP